MSRNLSQGETTATEIREGRLITRYHGYHLFQYNGMYWILKGSDIVGAHLRKSTAVVQLTKCAK